MPFIDRLDLLRRMDLLIRRKATGTPQTFARRLGMSRATLYCHLDELNQMGASVAYCRLRQTFYHQKEGRLIMAFVPYEAGRESQPSA